MFLKNSRYHGQATHSAPGSNGRVSLLVPRALPMTAGDAMVLAAHDQLDALAEARYRDATRYWHIADANTALRAGELAAVPGTTLLVPKA
jgi:hypothetical protein